MPKYRKKPLVIEAIQFKGHFGDVYDWGSVVGLTPISLCEMNDTQMKIETLEGDMIANKGDWIIKGVKGEFYPCKPDIFEATYELVE